MEAIKKHLLENYPVEKFRKPYQHIHDALLNQLAKSVQSAIPKHFVLSESGEIAINEASLDGFEKFIHDSKPAIEKQELPKLNDFVEKVVTSDSWRAFF